MIHDSEEFEAMFAFVVSDALSGVDIEQRYPAFFKQILVDDELQEAFLDAIELLEQIDDTKLIPLPEAAFGTMKPSPDLYPKPVVERTALIPWRIRWQYTLQQLRTLLSNSFLSPNLVWRQAGIDDIDSRILLRSEVITGQLMLYVQLEGSQPDQELDRLRLSLFITTEPDLAVNQSLPLRASLQWGTYQDSIIVQPNNPEHFSLVSLGDILNESGDLVSTEMSLTLEPVLR